MTHYLIGCHLGKGFELVIHKNFLYLRLWKIGVFPNSGRSWKGLLFPFVRHTSFLHTWRDFFHWSGRRSYPSWSSAGGGQNSWIPLIHNTNHPLPKGKKRFFLFLSHFCVHILIKYGCHLYEKEKKHLKKRKRKKKRRREGPRSMIALTLLFNCYGLENKGKRFWTKTGTSQSSRVNKVVKVVYFFRVLHNCLHTILIPTFKPWTLHNCTQWTGKLLTIKKKEKHRRMSI